MAETVSNVFDVACPNPLTLQEISSLAIIAELRRKEIFSYFGNSKKYIPISLPSRSSDIQLEKVLPNMPRRIYDFLNKYFFSPRIEDSIANWLCKHYIKVFETSCPTDGCYNLVGWWRMLCSFHDCALDWNGTIHEVRTARRMLLCDRISTDEKFLIACLYYFEDDIKRIWPSVSSTIDVNKFSIEYHPEVYYWTRFLRNELHKIPDRYDKPFEKMMLYECGSSKNYSCALYYWNRIPLESQSQALILDLSRKHPELFSRFILPKLNEPQLIEFLARGGENLISSQLLNRGREDADLVLPMWMYIRSKIDNRTFIALIEKLLSAETKFFEPKNGLKYQSKVYLCCEIWNSASQSLKQSVFDNLLLKGKQIFGTHDPRMPKETKFLRTVLSDASFENRIAFWNEHWSSLILGTRVDDLLEIVKLCFRNEEEIASFKENTLFKYENIRPYLEFMRIGNHFSPVFSEMNKFLTFCNSDPLKRTEMKQRFLLDPANRVSDSSSRSEKLEFLSDTV